MTNTFITPNVIASRGLATLYNTIVLAGLMSRDYDSEFNGKVGDTVTVRKPAVFTAEVFNRSTGVTLQDAIEDSIDITLNTIANVSFLVTDEQMTLEISDFSTQLLTPAMEAIAQKVDADLAEMMVDAATAAADVPNGLAAGAGVVTMTSVANDAYRGARTRLTRNNLPLTDRIVVLSPEATAVALADPLLIQADQSGSSDALREANIGRILGFSSYETQTLGEGAGNRGEADGVAFHRGAGILATRPLQQPRGVGDGQATSQGYRGLSLRIVYSYNNTYKQDEVSVDMLYGVKAARPEGIVELDFGQGS